MTEERTMQAQDRMVIYILAEISRNFLGGKSRVIILIYPNEML